MYKDNHGHVIVIFDNASGTFRSASEHLPNLQKLLEHNFPEQGLKFFVRSFDQVIDPPQLFDSEHQDMNHISE